MPVKLYMPLPGPTVWVPERHHRSDDGGWVATMLMVPFMLVIVAVWLLALAVYGLIRAGHEATLCARAWTLVLRRERTRRRGTLH